MSKLKIKTKKSGNLSFKAFCNDVYIGDIIQDVDGFYYFSFNGKGLWASYSIRLIADKLDKLNKKWNDKLNSYLNK